MPRRGSFCVPAQESLGQLCKKEGFQAPAALPYEGYLSWMAPKDLGIVLLLCRAFDRNYRSIKLPFSILLGLREWIAQRDDASNDFPRKYLIRERFALCAITIMYKCVPIKHLFISVIEHFVSRI